MYLGRSATIRCFAEGLLAGFQEFALREQGKAVRMAEHVSAAVPVTEAWRRFRSMIGR